MAKQRKEFKIDSPRGTIVSYKTDGGKFVSKLTWNTNLKPNKQEQFSRAQKFVDQECIRRMAPETPFRSGALRKSATLGTVIGSGEINQIAPYARRQYYEHKSNSKWFERMKNRHKDSILRGARDYFK